MKLLERLGTKVEHCTECSLEGPGSLCTLGQELYSRLAAHQQFLTGFDWRGLENERLCAIEEHDRLALAYLQHIGRKTA